MKRLFKKKRKKKKIKKRNKKKKNLIIIDINNKKMSDEKIIKEKKIKLKPLPKINKIFDIFKKNFILNLKIRDQKFQLTLMESQFTISKVNNDDEIEILTDTMTLIINKNGQISQLLDHIF